MTVMILARAFLAPYHADAAKYETLDIGVGGEWVPWLLFCGSFKLIERQAEGGRFGVFLLPSAGLGEKNSACAHQGERMYAHAVDRHAR